jgi:hypothetical protein
MVTYLICHGHRYGFGLSHFLRHAVPSLVVLVGGFGVVAVEAESLQVAPFVVGPVAVDVIDRCGCLDSFLFEAFAACWFLASDLCAKPLPLSRAVELGRSFRPCPCRCLVLGASTLGYQGWASGLSAWTQGTGQVTRRLRRRPADCGSWPLAGVLYRGRIFRSQGRELRLPCYIRWGRTIHSDRR